MKRYKVKGNISSYSTDGLITIEDLYNIEQAPILLYAKRNIYKYIDEIEGTDEEEKYMTKIFTYCSICHIRKIEVLDKNGNIIKTIIDNILGE